VVSFFFLFFFQNLPQRLSLSFTQVAGSVSSLRPHTALSIQFLHDASQADLELSSSAGQVEACRMSPRLSGACSPLTLPVFLQWDRLTFSRLTTIYIIFSLLHCLIQAALQISAFLINANAASFLFNIALQGNATTEFAVPAMSDNDIRLCKDVPVNYRDLSQCTVVWNGTASMNYLTGPGDVNNGQAAVNYDQAPPLVMSSVISSLAISASSSPSSLVSSSSPSASAVDLGAAVGAAAGLSILPSSAPAAVPTSASATVSSSVAPAKVITVVVVNSPTASPEPADNSLAALAAALDGSLHVLGPSIIHQFLER
jgi:hypothetical protein